MSSGNGSNPYDDCYMSFKIKGKHYDTDLWLGYFIIAIEKINLIQIEYGFPIPKNHIRGKK